jgi:hypothetical protein
MADERDTTNSYGFVPWTPPVKPAEPEEQQQRSKLASMVATNAFYKMWRGGDYYTKEQMEAAMPKPPAPPAPPAPAPAAFDELREELRLQQQKIEIMARKKGVSLQSEDPVARAAQDRADLRKDLVDRALKKASDERDQRQRRKLGRRLSKIFGV